jgi:hypothetical protein
VASQLESLQDDVHQLQHLFGLANATHWNRILEPTSAGLGSETGRVGALEDLKRYFGGMGSLNDVVFCAENNNIPNGYTAEDANRELKNLLDRIFREASLYGAPDSARSEWLRLESGTELPLRVLNAFRRPR